MQKFGKEVVHTHTQSDSLWAYHFIECCWTFRF